MSVTRGAAIAAIGLVLSWQAGATDGPKEKWSVSEEVSLGVLRQCLDGYMSVRRDSDHAKRVITQLNYNFYDTCNGSEDVVSRGWGRVRRDVMTGTALTSLHVVADTRDFVDLDFHSEGEPLIIDMIVEPTDGDFGTSESYGRSLQDGVFTRSRGSGVSHTAKLTGTLNLFEPTYGTIYWSRNRTIERMDN